MDLKKRLHLTLVAVSAVILVQPHFATTQSPLRFGLSKSQWVGNLPSFVAENENLIYNVAVDVDNNVYVGGKNVLFHFTPDLELKQTVTTGPVMDHPDCMHPSYPCNESKESTDNYNKVLQLVYNLDSRPCLLVCGSVYRQLCQIRPIENLNEYHWVHPFNQSMIVANSSLTTFTYFGRGYEDQQTMITAVTMKRKSPFLRSKIVEKVGDSYNFRYSFQNETMRSALEFSTWNERVVHDGGMCYDGYVFFLITSWQESISDYDTRLVRVCAADRTLQSYSELPIACHHPNYTNKLYGSAFQIDYSQNSDAISIYVTFVTDIGKGGTALCIYPMAEVIYAFDNFPKKCLAAEGHWCEQEMVNNVTDFCGSDVKPFTVSEPLVSPHFAFLPNSRVTAITTVKNNNDMVAIVGDESGDVSKISLRTGRTISKNHILLKYSSNSIKRPIFFDRDHKHVYLRNNFEIVKFPVASCRVHETCESCFTEGKNDPLICGWCGDFCAHAEECDDPGLFRRDTCTYTTSKAPRLFGIHPNKGPISGGTNVTLYGLNLDFESSKDRYFIVRGRLCNLAEYNATVAWCVTSNEKKADYPEKIALIVDGVTFMMEENPPPAFKQVHLSQSFEYIPDPDILQIQPGITTVSGLINVTVTGRFLDSVLSPQIVVKLSAPNLTNLEFLEKCWPDPQYNGTKLTCTTPTLVDEPWLQMPTRTSPLLTHVSFIMDGVQSAREFSQHQEFVSRLLYYPDPEFKQMENFADNQTSIEIKGNNFDILPSVNNFRVRLGEKDSCDITVVSDELLRCDLPPILHNFSSIGSNIPVRVFMGTTSHHLGNIQFIEVADNPVVMELYVLVICILGPLVMIIVAFLCFREIRKKKVLRKTSNALSISNRTESSYDYPNEYSKSFTNGLPRPMWDSIHSVSNATEKEEITEETLTLLNERMFILRELGLIIQKEHLVIGELIGAGEFGNVFKGTLQTPHQKEKEIAIKTLYQPLCTNGMKADLFLNEALTMRDFDHPHVLGLLGVCFEGSVPHIILPFMENGDLLNYIRDDTKTLLVTDLLKFAVDIASGMCYLATLKFVHRDLAARNCVLDSSMRAKVADFGLSRDIYERNYYRSKNKKTELPFRWTAPEVIDSLLSTIESDVWSYGVLLWELMTRGSVPYGNMGNWDLLLYIKLGNKLNQPQFCPKPLYFSMMSCWNTDSEKRPSFFNLHSYISEIYCKILNGTVTDNNPSTVSVMVNTMHFHSAVPAQNSICYDSKELYLKMENHILNFDHLNEAYTVMDAGNNVTVPMKC